MPYGLRVRNTSNEIQIDETWQTLRVREGGTLNILNNTGLTGYATLVDPPTPADAPLFAVHSTAIAAAAHTPIIDVDDLDDIDANGPIIELRCRKIGGSGVSHAVKWLCVDATTPAPTSDTYGLRVRNAAGESVFDSRQDLVLIRDVILVGTSATLTRTFSHATCRGTAYYASGLRRAYISPPGLEPVLYTKNLSASSVEVFFQSGNQLSYEPDPVPLLVLDVFD
jgi:hypothetical protein